MLFSKADGGREVSRDPPTPTPAPPVLEEDREKGRLLNNKNTLFENFTQTFYLFQYWFQVWATFDYIMDNKNTTAQQQQH